MRVNLRDPNGTTLKTANKYCLEDIQVLPLLQEITTTKNGVVVTSEAGYSGLSKVTVDIASYDGYYEEIPLVPYLVANNEKGETIEVLSYAVQDNAKGQTLILI